MLELFNFLLHLQLKNNNCRYYMSLVCVQEMCTVNHSAVDNIIHGLEKNTHICQSR